MELGINRGRKTGEEDVGEQAATGNGTAYAAEIMDQRERATWEYGGPFCGAAIDVRWLMARGVGWIDRDRFDRTGHTRSGRKRSFT